MNCNALAHITDSCFFRHGYTTDEARRIFCQYRRLQRWLEVEAALAVTQAELGVIPETAAAAIADQARLDRLDLAAVAQGIQDTDHSLIPLLNAWQAILPPEAARFLHYGATTQDIQDTAQAMELRDALQAMERDLARLTHALAALAARHAGTVMIGRTHTQPALPFTFGLKVAGWLDELLRHQQRLQELRPRLLSAQLFGGVGTMASFGATGPELLARFSQRLGLTAPACAWHASRDRLAEYLAWLHLVNGTLARMANETTQLSRQEIGELEEPFHAGKIGSSTMPHKRNPETCEQVVVLFRLVRACAAQAGDLLVSEHERDYRAVRLEWALLTDASLYTCGGLALAIRIADDLTVHTERMRRNAAAAAPLLASETLMFRLAEHIGKPAAHALLYDLAMRAAAEGKDFLALLLDDPTIRRHFDEEALRQAVAPEQYTGHAERLCRAIAQAAAAAAGVPHAPPAGPPACPLLDRAGKCRLDTNHTE